MQRKLLLALAIGSCPLMHCQDMQHDDKEAKEQLKNDITRLCDDYFGENEKILADYKKDLVTEYEAALIKAVAGKGDKEAIKSTFDANKENNKTKEQEKNALLDDSQSGYFNFWPSPATDGSVKGILQKQWKKLREDQDEENETFKKTYTQHEKDFNAHVKTTMRSKQIDRRYTLFTRYANGLDECGRQFGINDLAGLKACLEIRDISWEKLQDPSFLDKQDEEIDNVLYALVVQNKIPLTKERVIEIAATMKSDFKDMPDDLSGKTLKGHIAIGKKRVQEKVHHILNPAKFTDASIDLTSENKEKPTIFEDVKEDQGDQGALSQ